MTDEVVAAHLRAVQAAALEARAMRAAANIAGDKAEEACRKATAAGASKEQVLQHVFATGAQG